MTDNLDSASLTAAKKIVEGRRLEALRLRDRFLKARRTEVFPSIYGGDGFMDSEHLHDIYHMVEMELKRTVSAISKLGAEAIDTTSVLGEIDSLALYLEDKFPEVWVGAKDKLSPIEMAVQIIENLKGKKIKMRTEKGKGDK